METSKKLPIFQETEPFFLSCKKQRKLLWKKFLIFLDMKLPNSEIKKFLIFSQKKAFLLFSQKSLPHFLTAAPKILLWKKIFFFSKKSPIFWKLKPRKYSYILENGIFYPITFQDQKLFVLFLSKKQKILKHFLVIITWQFLSLHNFFSYTQQAFFFPLLRDFCNVHDHIVAFFLFFYFLFWEIFVTFTTILLLFSFFFFRKILRSFNSFFL